MFDSFPCINWRLEDRGQAKPAKVPVDITTGQRIDPHDSSRWLPYALARAFSPNVGIVLTPGDPYFCIDLDKCWTGTAWSPLALDTVARFPGAYCEVSYSGDGLHIMGRGVPPIGYSTRGPGVELYAHSRFIAITGNGAIGTPEVDCTAALASWCAQYVKPLGTELALPGMVWTTSPCEGATPIPDDQTLLSKMLHARPSAGVAFGGKASAADLWTGNVAALAAAWPSATDEYDRSAADGALAAHLAFWTGRDCSRIERLMRMSKLVRPKWGREDYLRRTIAGAAARTQRVYTGPQQGDGEMIEAEEYDFQITEDGAAVRLVAALGGRARYVAPWSSWKVFDGTVWRDDSTLAMFDAARRVCRELADTAKIDPALTEAARGKAISRLKQAATIAAVERIARSDRAVVATVDQWDADPWLLNTPSGVVDLRTGSMREHRPDDYMTRVTAVAPGGDCPTWRAFLHRVTAGDGELIAYLQRLAGYALTGSTREHILAFLHGSGRNGKGVFIGAISGVMGGYHRAAPIETFAASLMDHHPTELAMLRGARLVTSQETEEGRRWAESRIKSLTGGDRITARFMRQDYFEFDPQFTLVIAGNHKPGLRSVDEAIRSRFHLIPFVVTILKAERDERLPEKLKAEWPGILAWMIEGALAWQRVGLAPPPAVLAATEAYLDGQDALVFRLIHLHPAFTEARVFLARRYLARIDLAPAVHLKGFGF